MASHVTTFLSFSFHWAFWWKTKIQDTLVRVHVSVDAVGAAAPTVSKKSPFVPLKFEGLQPQFFQSHF